MIKQKPTPQLNVLSISFSEIPHFFSQLKIFKVLILYTDTMLTNRSNDVSSGNVFIQLLRDSTSVAIKQKGFYDNAGGNGSKSLYTGEALFHLDSPSSTSAITYKIQIKASSNTTVKSQYTNDTASIIAMEIGA